MGLDGGTVITRSDVLRGSSWRLNQANSESRSTRGGAVSTSEVYRPPALDRADAQRTQWSTCALSAAPLAAEPGLVVCDRLGNLLNREAVLDFLLARRGVAADEGSVHRFANLLRTAGARFEHLASTKDVFAVRLREDAAGPSMGAGARGASAGASSSGGGDDAGAAAPYRCPVTGLAAGRHTMVALAPCGHVVSQRALERVGGGNGGGGGGAGAGGGSSSSAVAAAAAAAECPVCGAAYRAGEDDVVVNGSDEQVAALRRRLKEARQGRGGGKRKRAKERQPGQQQEQVVEKEQQAEEERSGQQQREEQHGTAAEPPAGGAAPAAAAASKPRPSVQGKRVRIAEPPSKDGGGDV